ncbi:MAG: hypothetical protein EXQ60_06510 [Candidatus Nanopelagicales bacterium]|nr:hypothetical protein [Candidatus Nanopelagicales bacterium]
MSFLRRTSAVVTAGFVVGAVSGLALGVIWWRLAPRVPLVVRSGGAYPANYQPDGYLAADVSFGALALFAGLAVTIGLLVMRREHPLSVLVASLLAGGVGSVLMWFVGTRLGSVDIDGLVATTMDEGVIEAPLKISMPALLLVWPITAALMIFAVSFADWWGEAKKNARSSR